jgi:hypothetical protein
VRPLHEICTNPDYHHEDGSLRWGAKPDLLTAEEWATVLRDHRDAKHGLYDYAATLALAGPWKLRPSPGRRG